MSSSHTTSEAIQDAEVAQADVAAVAGTLDELEHRIACDLLDAADAGEIAAFVLPRLDALRAYFVDLAATAAVAA